MTYRITDDAALVVVRQRDGGVEYHSHGGPEIHSIEPDQAARYIELGLIERIEEAP